MRTWGIRYLRDGIVRGHYKKLVYAERAAARRNAACMKPGDPTYYRMWEAVERKPKGSNP